MADGVAASSFCELQEPEVIIVAPTRELINQIFLEARKFAFGYACQLCSSHSVSWLTSQLRSSSQMSILLVF